VSRRANPIVLERTSSINGVKDEFTVDEEDEEESEEEESVSSSPASITD